MDRFVRQHRLADDVANGKDVGHVGAHLDVDPIVQHHFANFMTQKCSDTFSMEQSALDDLFWAEARSFELAAGLTMGIHDKEKMRASLFSFAGKKLKQEPRHIMTKNYILPHLHQAFFKSNFGKINTCSELIERGKKY